MVHNLLIKDNIAYGAGPGFKLLFNATEKLNLNLYDKIDLQNNTIPNQDNSRKWALN